MKISFFPNVPENVKCFTKQGSKSKDSGWSTYINVNRLVHGRISVFNTLMFVIYILKETFYAFFPII